MRQAHAERCSGPVRVVVAGDFAVVFADYAVADAQAETGTFADFLGREERIEDAVRGRNAWPVVAQGDLNTPINLGSGDPDRSTTPCLANRVVGIVQNVEEDLLELMAVG